MIQAAVLSTALALAALGVVLWVLQAWLDARNDPAQALRRRVRELRRAGKALGLQSDREIAEFVRRVKERRV